MESWSLETAKSQRETQVSPGTGVCVCPTSFIHPAFKRQGNGLVQGHKGLELSERTQSRRVAPGCRQDVNIDTRIMKSYRRAMSRNEAFGFGMRES